MGETFGLMVGALLDVEIGLTFDVGEAAAQAVPGDRNVGKVP